MDWFDKIFKSEKKHYAITGEINYFVDVSFSGLLPYCDASIIVKAFSNSNKKIAIGCRILWFIVLNDDERLIDNKNLNYLHLSSELVGMQIRAVLEPIEDLYRDKAVIDFFTVRLDRTLMKTILTLKPTNNCVAFEKVEIFVDNKRTHAANFNITVTDTWLKINNYYQNIEFTFPLGEAQPLLANRYYDECIVELTIGKEDCQKFDILNEYFYGTQRRAANLIIRFGSRFVKEQFLSTVRHLQFRDYIKKESYVQIVKNLNEDSINLTNQVRLLNQENICLYNQLRSGLGQAVFEKEQPKRDTELLNANKELERLQFQLEETKRQKDMIDRDIQQRTVDFRQLENEYLDLQNSMLNLKAFGNKNNTSKRPSSEEENDSFVRIPGHNTQDYEKLKEENKRMKFDLDTINDNTSRYMNTEDDVNMSTKLANENKILKRELYELSKSRGDNTQLNNEIKRLRDTVADLELKLKRENINDRDQRLKQKESEITKLKEQNDRLVTELVTLQRDVKRPF